MFLKEFLYFLIDQNGKSYFVDNGMVDKTGVPTQLPTGPDGAADTEVHFTRNTRYFGMFRSYTTPLKFVQQGARIIRELFYKYGYEVKLYLLIHWLDKSFGAGWPHKYFYKGELDLSQIQDEELTTTVNIMEGGIDKLIKANENTVYEIPMNDIRSVTIKHDGIKLRSTGHYYLLPDLEIGNDFYSTSCMAPLFLSSEDGSAPLISSKTQDLDKTQTLEYANSVDYVNNSDNWFRKNENTFPVDVQLKGTVIVETVQNSVSGSYTLRFMTSFQTVANQDAYNFTGTIDAGTVGTIKSFDIDTTITLQPGEAIFLRLALIYPTSSIGLSVKFNEGSTIDAISDSRYQTTNIQGFRPITLGQILIDKMTGGGYSFKSDYLENTWNGLLVTPGDAIRGFETAKLKTSWGDFFDSYNAVTNLEMSLNEQEKTITVEPKAAAFQSTQILDLGDTADFKCEVAKDYTFNTVKVGYPNSTITDVNGRDEFNVTQTYTTPVTRISKELNLVSKYSASMYDIEFTRINLEGKDTTNSDTDNSVFFIHCENSPYLDGSGLYYYYKIRRDTYDSITGLVFPDTAYNIEISPKRNLIRHGNFLRACCYFNQFDSLVFRNSDKNAELTTTNFGTIISNDEIIKESGDQPITFLDEPLFIPLQFTFSSPIPKNVVTVMDSTPSGTVVFNWLGQQYKGFPMDIKIKPFNNPAQETVLLCSPESDITKLIH